MAQIPNDVIYSHILPRLPVKSLTRFKCVSKSWHTLISSANFIRLHHRHVLSSDANRLIVSEFHSNTHFVTYDLDSPLDQPLFYKYPKPETLVSGATATIVASCDFLVLIRIGLFLDHHKLVLVNPSTQSYREIPCSYSSNKYFRQTFGICLDKTNDDDYKVIMVELYLKDLRIDIEIMMYSSVTNSWRLIGHDQTPAIFISWSFKNFVIINKLLYITLGSIYQGNNMTKKYVRFGCFDIEAEQWTTDIPSPDDNLRNYSLHVLDGSLCALGNDKKNETYHVWVMKDCWVKLMSLDITDHSNRSIYYPIAYHRGSPHELLCRRHHEYCLYNFRDKVATHVAYDNYLCPESISHIDHVCRGSLVTFPNKLQKVVPWELYNSLQNKSTSFKL